MKFKHFKHIFVLFLAALLVLSTVLPGFAATTDENGNHVTVIVLDPGHGGYDSGAVGKHDGTQVSERDICWKIAQFCKAYLEENYTNVQVLLTRSESQNPSLDARVKFAADHKADYLLSIHLNAVTSGTARGALAIVPIGRYKKAQSEASRATAEAILKNLEALGLNNRGFMTSASDSRYYPDGSRADSYAIICSSVYKNIPATIVEHAFIDNSHDYHDFLSSDEKIQQLGIADALALAETLGLQKISSDSETPDVPDVPEQPEDPESSGETVISPIPFTDVPGNQWFYEDVVYVYEHNFMNGTSKTTFAPNAKVSRAMVATLLYRISGAPETEYIGAFSDVADGTWYTQPVEWGWSVGLTNGISPTEFAPNRSITRQDTATLLYRYAGMLGLDVSASADLSAFADADRIAGYASDAFSWAVSCGLINGTSKDTLSPTSVLSRAQLAAMIHRFNVYLESHADMTDPSLP